RAVAPVDGGRETLGAAEVETEIAERRVETEESPLVATEVRARLDHGRGVGDGEGITATAVETVVHRDRHRVRAGAAVRVAAGDGPRRRHSGAARHDKDGPRTRGPVAPVDGRREGLLSARDRETGVAEGRMDVHQHALAGGHVGTGIDRWRLVVHRYEQA